jgi:hypothetical protein
MNKQQLQNLQHRGLAIVFMIVIFFGVWFLVALPQQAAASRPLQKEIGIISSIWPSNIQQWEEHIGILAQAHGLDPDFIAAVIQEESNGQVDLVSSAGAVGLMGVMPTGPGLEWRPSPDVLKNPAVNLRWGVGILAEIVRQSGGDLYSALSAYTGGWQQVNGRVPRQYAANVLNNYGRAVMVRNGQEPEIANQWTIAIEMNRGNVPVEPLLVLGQKPLSGLHLYGKHTVYNFVDESGVSYYITGYAVPVALIAPLDTATAVSAAAPTSPALAAEELSQIKEKTSGSSPHVIMACLPSLNRLRGQSSTRWFAPSQCPAWHR